MTYILKRIILLRFINSTKTFAGMASKIPTMEETTTTRISTYVMPKHIPRWIKCFVRIENITRVSFHEIFSGCNSKACPNVTKVFVGSVNLTKGRFTNDFSIIFQIRWEIGNWFQLAALRVSCRCEIELMPIHHSCRAMCKISLWLLNYNMDASSLKFPLNLNYDENTVLEMGPKIVSYDNRNLTTLPARSFAICPKNAGNEITSPLLCPKQHT